MNQIEYLHYIKEKIELNAKKQNFQEESLVNIDWGELKFILSFVTEAEKIQEQFVNIDKMDSINHDESLVDAKLVAYCMFLKSKGLDDEFEYFWHEMRLNFGMK